MCNDNNGTLGTYLPSRTEPVNQMRFTAIVSDEYGKVLLPGYMIKSVDFPKSDNKITIKFTPCVYENPIATLYSVGRKNRPFVVLDFTTLSSLGEAHTTWNILCELKEVDIGRFDYQTSKALESKLTMEIVSFVDSFKVKGNNEKS